MIIKASASLRNHYAEISKMAKESEQPIFITVNGEGDGVFMSLETYEKREQMLALREKLLEAKAKRENGGKTYSIEEIEKMLEQIGEKP